MKFTVTGMEDPFSGTVDENGDVVAARGGSELMKEGLLERLAPDLADQFNIICSRVRDISEDKKNILWLHDTWDDPEAQHLREADSRSRFDKLVFVSNYQFQTYHMGHGIPYHESVVLKNAITPIEEHKKDTDNIRLIYHTTPHRGLEILVPVFDHLWNAGYKDKIHFDVYSSFEAYGWPQRDEPYKSVFKEIEEHDGMTYHGFKPNSVVREALSKAHIFAYPSIWQETSCIAAIEALSAGVQVVCPNLGALPETTGGFATMYHFNPDVQFHANVFANFLKGAIDNYNTDDMLNKLIFAKNWVDNFYSWDIRKNQWIGMLNGIKQIRANQVAQANAG